MVDPEVIDVDSDDLEDDEIEESASPFVNLRRQQIERDDAERTADKPLANTEAIPLLPNSNKKQTRIAKELKITKLDPPNHGYKGCVHLGADENYIAQLWGDGTYTIEAVNGKGLVVQSREAVRIATGIKATEEAPNKKNDVELDALERISISHEKERARADRIYRELMQENAKAARELADNLRRISEETRQRDKDFFQSANSQTQNFFQTILTQMRQDHEASMSRMREEHKQQVQMTELRNTQMLQMIHAQNAQNNPMMFLKLFQQGMEFAGNMNPDEEPWVKAISHGTQGLKELRLLAQATNGGATVNPRKRMNKNATKVTGKKPAVISKLKSLKAKLDARGISMEDFLERASDKLGDGGPSSDSGVGPSDT